MSHARLVCGDVHAAIKVPPQYVVMRFSSVTTTSYFKISTQIATIFSMAQQSCGVAFGSRPGTKHSLGLDVVGFASI
jgi:hypothetical protein